MGGSTAQIGYPERMPLDEFYMRYKALDFSQNTPQELILRMADLLIMKPGLWVLGHTKLLMKHEQVGAEPSPPKLSLDFARIAADRARPASRADPCFGAEPGDTHSDPFKMSGARLAAGRSARRLSRNIGSLTEHAPPVCRSNG